MRKTILHYKQNYNEIDICMDIDDEEFLVLNVNQLYYDRSLLTVEYKTMHYQQRWDATTDRINILYHYFEAVHQWLPRKPQKSTPFSIVVNNGIISVVTSKYGIFTLNDNMDVDQHYLTSQWLHDYWGALRIILQANCPDGMYHNIQYEKILLCEHALKLGLSLRDVMRDLDHEHHQEIPILG